MKNTHELAENTVKSIIDAVAILKESENLSQNQIDTLNSMNYALGAILGYIDHNKGKGL